jgi:Tfp pilus assembly ATPase PilU
MGQQQLLLLVLGIVIVGLAVVVGIQAFSENQKQANTGHLTFSTLHTNDAPAAVSRLYKMGVEPFLIAYAINLVVAQRLIRVVCPDCK